MALVSHSSRIKRRNGAISLITSRLSWIRALMFTVGYGWLLLLPLGYLSKGAWIDENALQPSQVTTYWNWGEVHLADRYLAQLERLVERNATSDEKADFIQKEFENLGLASSTQNYSFSTKTAIIEGRNAYAVLRSPRTSGTEAIVISASWTSLQGGPNLRGIAFVLELAEMLKRSSVWAKDLVFVISDGYLDGINAWLGAYHGSIRDNAKYEPLLFPSGVIWTALCIDYPGHSFSHLGVFFEGTNGRLPNQDLINSASKIAAETAGIPFVLYNHVDPITQPSGLLSWIPGVQDWIHTRPVVDYRTRAANILKHMSYQATSAPSGIHGLFHRYRIDAITLFAVPARGPHGFYSIGRMVESTLRTMNNLLERLHASFFFYLFTAPSQFLPIGFYLPPVIVISIAVSFGGLSLYVALGWHQITIENKEQKTSKTEWAMRDRPVIEALTIMGVTHISGIATLILTSSSWWHQRLSDYGVRVACWFTFIPAMVPIFVTLYFNFALKEKPTRLSLSPLLKSFNLCLAGAIIAVTAVSNFSLSAALAVLLGLPLSLTPVDNNQSLGKATDLRQKWKKWIFAFFLGYLTPQGLLVNASRFLGDEQVLTWVQKILWEQDVLGSWFCHFVWTLYTPLIWQALIATLF